MFPAALRRSRRRPRGRLGTFRPGAVGRRCARPAPHASEGGDGFLVCLAACTTHLTTQAFDGAFTLATAFLVGGASTVVASLWRVDDDPTAVLMFMLHHHLARGLAPADALRRAQLWMIDPERLIPASMPAAVRRVVRVANLSDPASWASMVHHDGDRRVASAGQRADQVARARLSA